VTKSKSKSKSRTKSKKGVWVTYKGRHIFITNPKSTPQELKKVPREVDGTLKVLGGITLAGLAAMFLRRKSPVSELFRDKKFVVIARHPRLNETTRDKIYRKITSAIMGIRVVRPKAGAKIPNTVGLVHTWSKKAHQMKMPLIQDMDLMTALDNKGTFPQLFKNNPEIVPQTFYLREFNSIESARAAFQRAGKGFVVKPTVGSLSNIKDLPTHEWSNARLAKYIENHGGPNNTIIQELLPFTDEFRVHYVNGKVFSVTQRHLPDPFRKIYDKYLPFGGGGGAFLPTKRSTRRELTKFVTKAMDPYKSNVHVGLDVVRLPDNTFRLLEGNPVPGTLMNPIVARKLHRTVTGVWTADIQALSIAGAAAGVWSGYSGITDLMEKEKKKWESF